MSNPTIRRHPAGRPRRRARSGHGLKSWNFWTPVNGCVYGVRGYHRGRVRYIYGGKTTQNPWTKRPEDHLWARHWEKQPKFWAHTVLGYRPGGTIQEVIAAGGVFIIWQARTVPLVLSLVEVIWAIKIKRPVHNRQWNINNRRRSSKYEIEAMRYDQQMVQEGLLVAPPPRQRSGAFKVGVFITALFMGLMLLPGMPAGDAVVSLWESVMANRTKLLGWAALLLGALYMVARGAGPKRRRARRRRR